MVAALLFQYRWVSAERQEKVATMGVIVARTILNDKQWTLVESLLPGKPGDRGRTGENNRYSFEGMLWIMRTGAPWRDLPPEFGNWNTIHHRFRRWTKAGIFDRIAEAGKQNLDLKAVMVDGSFAKVHQHGTGAPKGAARPRNRQSVRRLAAVVAGLRRRSWRWWTRLGGWSGSP